MNTHRAASNPIPPLTPAPSPSGGGGYSAQLAALVRLHHSELVRHVYQHIHSWPDAGDIVQQIYENILRTPGLATVTNARAYLFRSASNLAKDWQRKKRVRDAYVSEEPLRAPTLAISAGEACESRQALEFLLQKIDTLPHQCRMALLLVRVEELSIEEAAARLGIKPKSVRSLLARALKHLLATVTLENLMPGDRS
jgi:RNA polymerase sigma factor (sigma-70 family)